jgi:hypothetical protein
MFYDSDQFTIFSNVTKTHLKNSYNNCITIYDKIIKQLNTLSKEIYKVDGISGLYYINDEFESINEKQVYCFTSYENIVNYIKSNTNNFQTNSEKLKKIRFFDTFYDKKNELCINRNVDGSYEHGKFIVFDSENADICVDIGGIKIDINNYLKGELTNQSTF